MSTLLTLFLFLMALNANFQEWFKNNMQVIVVGFILFGIIDWIIIINYFTKVVFK